MFGDEINEVGSLGVFPIVCGLHKAQAETFAMQAT